MGRPLSAVLRGQGQRIALTTVGALLLLCTAAPFVALVREVVLEGGLALSVLGSARTFVLLLRTVALALVVTLIALGAGVPLGLIVGRTDAHGRAPAMLLHAFPVFLPPFLNALGWFHVLGAQGLVGGERTSGLLFSGVGVGGVLATTFTPIATVLVALGLQGIDPALEDAARVVARPVRVVVRILMPAAAPAIALAGLIVFVLSLSELGVPMFLRWDTYPASVFARLGGVDYAPGEAFSLVLPLVPVALALLVFERRLVGARSFAVLGLRAAREPLPLGRWRGPVTVLLWAAAVVSVTPIGALLWRSTRGGGFSELGDWVGRAPWNSLWTGGAAATLIVAIGVVLGHAVARRAAGSAVLDALCVLGFVTPAAIIGVGLIAVWNRPGLQWVYGSAAILVVGYVARYAVMGARTVATLVAQTPVQLEEAAASAGAGFFRRLTRILVPLHARGIGFAWLLAFAFCLRDLELPVLYYPPGGEPTTVRIFTLEANGPEPVVAALAVTHVAMTAAVVAAGGLLLRTRWR